MTPRSICAALFAALLVLAGCGGGGGGGDTPPPATPPNVTAAGGTVSSVDGSVQLVVPSGAAATPMSVTLAKVANPSVPPDADIVEGSVVELGGNGGALAAPAQITIGAARAFPLAAEGRMRALPFTLRGKDDCDFDNDGDVDDVDHWLASFSGQECYWPPKLVKLTPQTATLLGECNPPVGLTAGCTINSLVAGQLALQMDLKAPTITVADFDGPVYPARLTVPRSYTLRVNASDNKGVARVRFSRYKPGGGLLLQQLGEDLAAPYEISVPLTAADNGELYLIARAWDAWGNIGSTSVRLMVAIDTEPPSVSLQAAATTVTVGQAASFTATADDNVALTRVELVRNGVTVATDQVPPYTFQTAPFTEADIGTLTFVARAVDASDNATLSAPVTIQVQAPADTSPPAVTLQASATSAQVGQAITLTAGATDNVGVTKVEFLRNGTKVAEDTSAPYEHAPPAFTAGDVGTVVYAARAFDAAGNQGTSANVSVTVNAAPGSEVHVNATSGLDTNSGSAAAPLRTLAKAFQTVGAGGTVWLQNGVFTAAGEGLQGQDIFTGRTLPAGAAVKAVNDGGATLGFPLQVPAGGSIVGLNFDASSSGRVQASGGTLVLSRPAWVQLGVTKLAYGISTTGAARVLLDPKGNPQHNYAGSGLTGFASAADTSEIVVTGGVIDGTTGQAGAFELDGSAKLTLDGVSITNTGGAWVGGGGVINVGGTTNVVALSGTTIDLAGAGAVCILADRAVAGPTPTAQITISSSTLTRCGGGGMQLREGLPQVTITSSALTNHGRFAIEAGQIGFDSGTVYAKPQITASNLTATGNALGGIFMNMGGGLSITGGTVNAPQGLTSALTLSGDKPYTLLLRNVAFDATFNGVRLEGDATSSFDLGTLASSGGNTIKGATTGLRLTTAAGVTVQAVGNTWSANVQGADASGKYAITSSVCGNANPCEVTAGTGPNYTFAGAGAGAKLRLAQQ